MMEPTKRKLNYLGDNSLSRQVLLSGQVYPRIKVIFGGNDAFRDPMEIDAEQFIAVKGFKAKGKRVCTWQVEKVEELEPLRQPEPQGDGDAKASAADDENLDPDAGKSRQQIIDEITGQLNLFDDKGK